MKFEFSRQVFQISSNIAFHQNSSSGSQVVPDARRTGRQDIAKLIVAFRNFVNATKNGTYFMSDEVFPEVLQFSE